jgi:hypothetical protein
MIVILSTHSNMRVVKDGAGLTIDRPYLIWEPRCKVVGLQ